MESGEEDSDFTVHAGDTLKNTIFYSKTRDHHYHRQYRTVELRLCPRSAFVVLFLGNRGRERETTTKRLFFFSRRNFFNIFITWNQHANKLYIHSMTCFNFSSATPVAWPGQLKTISPVDLIGTQNGCFVIHFSRFPLLSSDWRGKGMQMKFLVKRTKYSSVTGINPRLTLLSIQVFSGATRVQSVWVESECNKAPHISATFGIRFTNHNAGTPNWFVPPICSEWRTMKVQPRKSISGASVSPL